MLQVDLSCVCSCYTELHLEHPQSGPAPSDWMLRYGLIASDNPTLIFTYSQVHVTSKFEGLPSEKGFSAVLTQVSNPEEE